MSKRYAIANTPEVHQLKTELASCKQDSLEVVEFWNKLMGFWSELDNYTKIPHCTCGKCECKIGDKIMKMVDEGKAHQFLMGLKDESFSTMHNQILPRDLLPQLDDIFNIIQQEENHKRVMMD